jgi:hypothetical protein
VPIGLDPVGEADQDDAEADGEGGISPPVDPAALSTARLVAEPETWFMPSANPRFSRGNASVRMAAELAVSMDPPRAWTTRQPMSHCAPRVPVNGQREIETDAPEDRWRGR